MSLSPAPKTSLLTKLRDLLGSRGPAEDLRASARVRLPIPVWVETSRGETSKLRLRDASLHGLCVVGIGDAAPGEMTTLHFDGYPDVCQPFSLEARVVRIETDPEPAVAVALDRPSIPKEAFESYRRLVLHYLRHRALLDKLERGFAEMRCVECRWIGHVSAIRPRCSRCGGEVKPVTRAPGSV